MTDADRSPELSEQRVYDPTCLPILLIMAKCRVGATVSLARRWCRPSR
jgi:hypothetical protein